MKTAAPVPLNRFLLDETTGVHFPSAGEETAFGYTDGGMYEDYILSVLQNANDVSDDSDELMSSVKDWPSYYHFGIGRSTIFRCLSHITPSTRVLELGGGCGALTRYLGERAGSVDVVEGSPARSRIAAERCRDLDNVRIYCANLSDIEVGQPYDLVTLIGVLEYAPIYFAEEKTPEEACLELLKSARKWVGPSGRLALAIENKVGLKYWSGCPEDHTGRIYDGIHGYPRKPSPVTFSKHELSRLLHLAGFESTSYYYCYPDYKFAATILSDTGEEDSHHLYNWVQPPFVSHDNPRITTFHEALAARSLSQAGLLRELANSFLVTAGTEPEPPPSWIARRYSVKRQKTLRCETTLETLPGVQVNKRLLESRTTDRITTETGSSLIHRVKEADWLDGEVLTYSIYEASLAQDFETRFQALLERFHRELLERYGTGKSDTDGFPAVRGDAYDFVFRNIITKGESWHAFDDEWQFDGALSADFVMYRCIRTTLTNLQRYGLGSTIKNPHQAAVGYIRAFYPSYGGRRNTANQKLEDSLQRLIVGAADPKLLPRGLHSIQNETVLSLIRSAWNLLPARVRLTLRGLASRLLS